MSRHGHRLNFDQLGVAICPESGLRYQLNDNHEVRCLDLDEEASLPGKLSCATVGYRDIKRREMGKTT